MPRLRLLIVLFVWMGLLPSVLHAQTVRAVVVNEFANLRITPALGASVITTLNAGHEFKQITARSADGQWLRVIYGGEEGWVNITPLQVLEGDINSLPIADPRTIPYGGFEAPRSGLTNVIGAVEAVATDNLRIRSGPGTGYPMLANIFYNQVFTITGRTASNTWYQVSFEGTLGWVSARYVTITKNNVLETPIDGIVATSAPRLGNSDDDFIATLRMMLDRLNNAQPSIDTMRTYWTDAALNGRASCRAYPAQPSDLNLPTPLLAAYYNTFDPLLRDFNDAMYNVRLSITLFIEVCNQPGTANPVGQATVSGALGVVNLATSQFDSLRARINALLPPDDAGCLLSFNGKFEALPLISIGTIYLDGISSRNYALGYCFDGIEGQEVNLQALPLPDSDMSLFISLSPLDAPRNFLAVNRVGTGARLAVGPIVLPRTTRYLLIFADLETSPQGQFALLVQDKTFTPTVTYLVFDSATQSIVLSADPAVTGIQPVQTGGEFSVTPTASTPTTVCPSTAFTCSQLFSCQEAKACLSAGNFSLDPDGDGIPCEEVPLSCTN